VKTVLAFLRFGRPPARRVVSAIGLGSLTVLAGVGLMSLAGYLISRAAEHPPILSLTAAIVAVRAFGIGRPVARYYERLQSHDLAFRVLARIRVAFYRKLEPQVPADARTHRQGDLLIRMVGDVDATQDLFVRDLAPPVVAFVAATASVALAASFLPAAGLVLAIGLALGGIALPAGAALLGGRTGPRYAKARAALTAELVELLHGGPELVVLGADGAASDRISALDAELVALGRREALAGGIIEGLTTIVAGLTVVGVLAVSVHATAVGALDRVMIAALALGSMAAFEAVASLPAAGLGLRSTLESAERILAIADRMPSIRDPADPRTLPSDSTLGLDDVTFDYADDETWGLRDIDLRLAPGRRIALVGPSGAGKSTVAHLLVRFLDPSSGRVTLGDTDMRDLRQRDVRSVVALDAQDAYLFSTSIRENVRLARPTATDLDIEDAVRRANLWPWIERLPDGLDTQVGEEGSAVSGGERRRIALARALLADTPVLVLDEPTAHLDPPTANAVFADTLAASRGRSVLVITHRVEDLANVDDVITLRRGRIVGFDAPGG
jgi:ATP-binding cassette, subfamily C, bacterial CydC